MNKFLLWLLRREKYCILDVNLIHELGKKHKGSSVYVGLKSDWDKTRSLAYRRGHYNADFDPYVTSDIDDKLVAKIMQNGRLVTQFNVYFVSTRKKTQK